MPVIAIFNGIGTLGSEIAAKVAEKLECPLAGKELLEEVIARYGVSSGGLEKTLNGDTPFFNNVTHEKEKRLIYLKAAVAARLDTLDLILHTRAAMMIPAAVTHVLKIGVVADRSFRIEQVMKKQGVARKAAERIIDTDDQGWSRWSHTLFNKQPWDVSLYDLKIPSNSVPIPEAVEMILENAAKAALHPTAESLQAVRDFMLAGKINAELATAGYHYCDVKASEGRVEVIINRNVLRLERLERELVEFVEKMDGVEKATAKVGPNYNQPDIAMKFDFEVPVTSTPNILLVDDEAEYVTTLSERLGMRDFPSDVVLDGESALSYIEQNKPDVMVLDLRMPGLDGVEVLRRVKRDHPEIEVIILTGHGTEKDRDIVLDLGAFAYLEKPVSIDELGRTLKEAGEAAKRRRHG